MSASKEHIQTMTFFVSGGEDWAWKPDVHHALHPEKEKACACVCVCPNTYVYDGEREGKEEILLSFNQKKIFLRVFLTLNKARLKYGEFAFLI